jgi:hypothetical protein
MSPNAIFMARPKVIIAVPGAICLSEDAYRQVKQE